MEDIRNQLCCPINRKDLSIGSIVIVDSDMYYFQGMPYVCEVLEILSGYAQVKLICPLSPFVENELAGRTLSANYDNLFGLPLRADHVYNLGFSEAEEKAWDMKYWFGNGYLLYRWKPSSTGERNFAHFRYVPDATQKTYVRMSCYCVHDLQHICYFLTGGELQFTYKPWSKTEKK